MPPRTRKTAAPGDLAKKRPANLAAIGEPADDLDALRDEVAAEGHPDPTWHQVQFGDGKLRIKDFLDWPASVNDMFAYGRFTAALAQIVHPDDFATIYAPANPTNRQIINLLRAMGQVTGLPLEMLLASLASSVNIAGR